MVFGLRAYTVLTDCYGLGLNAGPEGPLFTVGGIAVWALILALFFRPIGRATILKVVALIHFVWQVLWFLFRRPKVPQR